MNEWEWQLLEEKTPVDHLEISGIEVRTGSRVRLRPRKGGDVMDIALAGQIATIECIEQDYEGKSHVCVVLDEDPGRDMGLLRQPGHRFFFDAEEVEPLSEEEARNIHSSEKPSILVAGIGNIFLGDDAFGVEVVRRMAGLKLPESVRVADFGIRGFDLAYALQDGYETTILVDACPHGEAPGTLYVIEPDLKALDDSEAPQAAVEAHAMNPDERAAHGPGDEYRGEERAAGRLRAGNPRWRRRADGTERRRLRRLWMRRSSWSSRWSTKSSTGRTGFEFRSLTFGTSKYSAIKGDCRGNGKW